MSRLVIAPEADADAIEILDYLDREAGAHVAEAFSLRFQEALDRLVRFPESGAPRLGLGRQVRIALVPPYLLIYEYAPDEDVLTLLRVLHGKRNISPALLGR